MLTCWKIDPDDRPTFTDICGQLMSMLEAVSSQNYLDAIQGEIEVDEIEVEGSGQTNFEIGINPKKEDIFV
jgi:hypothetical protein